MLTRKFVLSSIKTPISVILSAITATFIFSFGSLFLDTSKYKSLIWIIDTTFYSYLFTILFELLSEFLKQKLTIIQFDFYNPKEKNNKIIFSDDNEFKRVKIYINITGNSHNVTDTLRIYEPNGVTLQLVSHQNFIYSEDGSYYEINLKKLLDIDKKNEILKRKNMNIKRTFSFDIALDDYENEYKDELYIYRKSNNLLHKFLLRLRQNTLSIER